MGDHAFNYPHWYDYSIKNFNRLFKNSSSFERFNPYSEDDDQIKQGLNTIIPDVIAFIKPILHDFIQDPDKEEKILCGEISSDVLGALLEEYVSSGMAEKNLDAHGYLEAFKDSDTAITPGMLEIGIIDFSLGKPDSFQLDMINLWNQLIQDESSDFIF